MNIGEEISIGRMGQQPMHIADATVDPQHAILRRTGDDTYQIVDCGSTKGVFVFGMRVKRKTVNADTPILLGSFKTTAQQLLQSASSINLQQVWDEYETEKRKWDRKSMIVNYIRVLPSMLAMLLGLAIPGVARIYVTVGLTVTVLVISMIASEKIMTKKNMKMAELDAALQSKYVCPHCHRPLPKTPYQILKQKAYCPNPACNCPLP